MILAIDIDDTICNLQETVVNIFNQRYGKKYSVDDFHDFDVTNVLPEDEATNMISIYGESGLYKIVKPISNAKNALQKLINKGHQIYLVTNAVPGTYGEKVEFVKKYFPYIDDAHIVSMKHKHLFRCDVMVDDCLQNILAKPYYHRVLIDRPWNRSNSDYAYGIYRCYNWNEVLEAIDKIDELEE
jgi:5'(3')-deoxyribonucleotidase